MSKLITISEAQLLAIATSAFRRGFNTDSMPEYEGAAVSEALHILQEHGIIMPTVVKLAISDQISKDYHETAHQIKAIH